ncbi:MAG: RagB/SusD family nutrient uptake outer membrane protein [Chitinophagaceae bacterium]|nr:RagB/SusD family nutrient uptake outer membrane protein [Chitinophagaceae bacterium]MCZ2397539.1 RagB/SusD family nutrient uptake outer membrane protein [Chitinophagales bacterium]
MNIKKLFFFLSLSGAVLVSCDKLDMPPTDSIDPTKAFRNLNDLNMGVLGAYAPLDYTLIETGAIVSDEVMLPTENTVSNTVTHRWMYNSSYGSVTSAWNEYYLVIDRANRVLEAVPNIPVTGATQSTLDQYHGEMLALRAFSHFELLKAYASKYSGDGMGVPYMKKHELGYPARPTVQSNFDDINADLQAAKDLIPASFNVKTRITRAAVSAIQARVALYAKDWDKAITYATEVINQEPLAARNDFGKIWIDQSNAEVIWELARVPGDSKIGSAFFRETGEIVLYAPAFKLLNTFDRDNDVRFSSYITYDQLRQDNSGGKKSAYLIKKYNGGDPLNLGLTDIKLFRTGEMYLIRAEALLEKDGSPAGITVAAKDLNELRKARIIGYVDASFPDKQSLLDAIYNERFKELAFEGHRFFDLKRRNLPVERLPQDAINASGAVKLEPTAAQYCFPIPSDEMSVNKAMVQNPNY